MMIGMPAAVAFPSTGLITSTSIGEMAMTSTLRWMKSSMMATWSAKATWVAGEREMTSTAKPFLLASAADFSKKSVAVLNTPVMSGGVQPIVPLTGSRAIAALAPNARATIAVDSIVGRIIT